MKGNSKRLVSAMERELGEAELRHRKQKLEQRLKQLERFEAIRRLAGGIAHDFNNIIGTIMGWAELGYEHASAHPLSQQRFDKIRGEARRADGLTSQLLAFARWQVLQPKALDLNQSIANMTALLTTAIGEHIEFKTVLPETLGCNSCRLHAD